MGGQLSEADAISTLQSAREAYPEVHCGLSPLYSSLIIQDASAHSIDTMLKFILGHGYDHVVSIIS